MRWANLKTNRCPNDGTDLSFYSTMVGKVKCKKCGFSISDRKMEDIVRRMVASDIEKGSENNQLELNEL